MSGASVGSIGLLAIEADIRTEDADLVALTSLAARKACLGGLINYAGMQRMLSHRAVMFLAMGASACGQSRCALLGQAEQAIGRFTAIESGFRGDYSSIGAPLELIEWITEILAPRRPAYEALTARFREEALAALKLAQAGASSDPARLANLVDLVSTRLLSELNGLVEDLNTQLTLTSRQEQVHVERIGQDISGMLADIRQVGLKIKMISVNALIQASRAGEAGRGFAVIANEIKELSDQMQAVAAGIDGSIRKVVSR